MIDNGNVQKLLDEILAEGLTKKQEKILLNLLDLLISATESVSKNNLIQEAQHEKETKQPLLH